MKNKSINMKKILLSALALGLATIATAQTWALQTSGTTNNLKSIHFTSTSDGLAVGDGGKIIRTTNGGSTWSNVNNMFSNGPVNFTNVFALGTNAWITTDSGFILYSTNSGSTWSISSMPNYTTSLEYVHFGTPLIGWAAGNNLKALYKTVDGGLTWTAEPLGVFTSNTFAGLQSIGTNTVILINGDRVYFSSDAGFSWNYQIVATNIRSLKSIDAATSWLTRNQFGFSEAYKSTVFGNFLPAIGNLTGGPYWSIDAYDANNAIIASGTNSNIYKTINGGTTWTQENIPASVNYISKIFYLDANNAWAVSGGGTIIKYSSSVTAIKETKISDFMLYPNPTNSFITINSQNKLGTIKITNLLGAEVLTLEENETNTKIDLSNFNTGVYFIKVGNNTTKFIKE